MCTKLTENFGQLHVKGASTLNQPASSSCILKLKRAKEITANQPIAFLRRLLRLTYSTLIDLLMF